MKSSEAQVLFPHEEKQCSNLLNFINGQKIKGPAHYQITNPDKLAIVGASYLEDFKKGIKSFAICSTNYKASQQRTVLALASYFEHLFDLKILIISDSLFKGTFKELVNAAHKVKFAIPHRPLRIEILKFYHHFDFIDLNEIEPHNINVLMQDLLPGYDLVFWDAPVLGQLQETQILMKEIASLFESLSIVVPLSVSKKNNLKELKKHFDGLGINTTGVSFKEITRTMD